MGCCKSTVLQYAHKLGFQSKFHESDVSTLTNEQKKQKALKEMEERCTSALLDALKENPDATRTELRIKLHNRYSWLFKHKRDWIEEVLPAPIKDMVGKNRGKYKIDWDKRDIDIQSKILKAMEEIKAEVSSKRITRYYLFKKIGHRGLEKFLNRMPQTKQTIEASIETDLGYKQRKIDSIIHELLKSGQIPDRSIVIQKISSKIGYTRHLIEYADLVMSKL